MRKIRWLYLVVTVALAQWAAGSPAWANGGHHGGHGHHGHHHHGHHHHHGGLSFGINLGGFGGGYGGGYGGFYNRGYYGMPYSPAYYGSYYSPRVIVTAPPEPIVYIQQQDVTQARQVQTQPQQIQYQAQTNYWHYCRNPEGYYPYVKQCSGGWLQVAPQPSDR